MTDFDTWAHSGGKWWGGGGDGRVKSVLYPDKYNNVLSPFPCVKAHICGML